MRYFDSHCHLSNRNGAAEALVREMDSLGIAKTVVVGGGAITPDTLSRQIAVGGMSDVDIDNAALLAACLKSNGRLIPFYFANPHRGVLPYLAEGGAFRGLKLGPAVHGIALTDDRTRALVAAARDFHHPVYLHCLARPGFDVEALVQLAREFRDVTFILGHAGIGNCDLYAVSLVEKELNILFETSGGFTSVVTAACRRLGAHRVLFGSEYPLQSPRAEIEKNRCATETLTKEEIALVMGGNIATLIQEAFHA